MNRQKIKSAIDYCCPRYCAAGEKTCGAIEGWVFCEEQRIKKLRLLVNRKPEPIKYPNLPRTDIHLKFPNVHRSRSLFCGFLHCFTIDPQIQGESLNIELEVTLKNDRAEIIKIADIPILDKPLIQPLQLNWPESENKTAICMATFNPNEQLFEKQMQSIKGQHFKNWFAIICDDCSTPEKQDFIKTVIADDSRFIFAPNESNVGFYQNFERCLNLVPKDADFAALADQDDFWYPQKLSACLDAFTCDDIKLVYSNMKISNADGKIIADSFWTNRENYYNRDDFQMLCLANTVTGASCVFRREVLDHALPFAPKSPDTFHDHWLAVIASCLGKIEFIDTQLYDYTMHGENVIGLPQMGKNKSLLSLMKTSLSIALRGDKLKKLQNIYNLQRKIFFQYETFLTAARCRAPVGPCREKLARLLTFGGVRKASRLARNKNIQLNTHDQQIMTVKLMKYLAPFFRLLR